ncbi:MAG: hypothetical protein IKL27_01795, partial [Oscillospiraceae bacterium]|nr:hypothetical protein [Oscillospiraceae bacterium]
MYTFKPATERILHMRQLIRDRCIRTDAERTILTTEAHKKYAHVVPIIQRPLIFKYVCENVTCPVEDFEIIVGSRSKYFCGSTSDPQWMGAGFMHRVAEQGWTLREDGLYHNNEKEDGIALCIGPEDIEAFKSVEAYWEDKGISKMAEAWQPDGYQEFAELLASDYGQGMGLMMIPVGHLVAGYKKIINVGYGAIRAQAQAF